jgi:hypothetical protein
MPKTIPIRPFEGELQVPADLTGVNARLPLIEENDRRSQAALRKIGREVNALALKAQDPGTPIRGRMRFLLKAADLWGTAYAPHAACKSGCSHCCHIPVALSRTEAQMIGEAIGVKPAEPTRYIALDGEGKYGYDHPCKFLDTVKGECRIYKHRPYSCRVQYNMDVTEALCRLRVGERVEVPYANNLSLAAVYATFALDDGGYAELGEFFPHGLGK